jgi:amino acid transporter
MSRDGLLPKKFSHIHPIYKTPSFATKVTGWVVAIPALFLNLNEVTELTSIGTLFAFVLVCGGILLLHNDPSYPKGRFRTPYVNGKWILPAFIALLVLWLIISGNLPALPGTKMGSEWYESIPSMIFLLCTITVTWFTFRHNWNLIPVLGMLSCLYLMSELGWHNWMRFGIWLAAGLLIYFAYSRKNSKLNLQ